MSPEFGYTHLPELRQADCGHYIPLDSSPIGRRANPTYNGAEAIIPVYLCPQCASRLRQDQPELVVKRGPGRPRKQQP